MLAAARLIAMLWLSAGKMGGSDRPGHVCPPLVEYTSANRARPAAAADILAEAAMVVRMLSDNAVLRDQARVCE